MNLWYLWNCEKRRKGLIPIAKRRPNGDGTVRKRADGRWEARIVAGHKKNGLPIYKSYAGKTQKEVMRMLHELKETYRGVELTEDSSMTLGDWLDKWMREYKAPPVLRQSTYNGYTKDIENHIKPYLGAKIITQIKQSDVQKFVNKLKKDGRLTADKTMGKSLASATVRGIHSLLHESMESAVLEGLIPLNPCADTVLPKLTRKDKTIVGIAEMQRLMELLREDEQWHDFFLTDFLTGMRRGEICGLRWEDFDEAAGKLKVQRTITYNRGELVISPPKTEEGKRTVYLPNTLHSVLSERKKTAVSEWIFYNLLDPSEPVRPQTAYNRLKKLLVEAKLDTIRFHDIRHSFASNSFHYGMDVKMLANAIGHQSVETTVNIKNPHMFDEALSSLKLYE